MDKFDVMDVNLKQREIITRQRERINELEKVTMAAIGILPRYNDPLWDTQFDNIRCDIDYIRTELKAIQTKLVKENTKDATRYK
jgi:hypothetical protein